MLTDETTLAKFKPTRDEDKFMVRYVDGGLPQLERLLNILTGWKLTRLTMAGPDRPVVVFERDEL